MPEEDGVPVGAVLFPIKSLLAACVLATKGTVPKSAAPTLLIINQEVSPVVLVRESTELLPSALAEIEFSP